MRFWDSSALLAIVLEEEWSSEMRRLLDTDGEILTSILTPIEISSAIWRRTHHRDLSSEDRAHADATFAELSRSWLEVSDFDILRHIALDLLSRHLLHAADALQLASAVGAGPYPNQLPFVTLDRRLAAAARTEGFTVYPTNL